MSRKKKWSGIVVTAIVALALLAIPTGVASVESEEWCESDACKVCTCFGVGKDATVDGSVISSQSADCGMCEMRILFEPAADHEPGDMRILRYWPQISGGWEIEKSIVDSPYAIPQVAHTYAYFWSVFGLMNEHQLGIAEETRGADRAVNAAPGVVGFGVTEFSALALERCTTAREAIELMGWVAEKYGFTGYSRGECLFVQDPEEVWVWEIVRPGPEWSPDPELGYDLSERLGCAWAAQRIPDDEVVCAPNIARIGQIDLDDPDNFMASANIFDLAIELELWDPDSGEPFVMYKAYGNGKASVRLWDSYRQIAPSLWGDRPFTSDLDEYPFSIKPDEKLSVFDIAALYRDHAEGTEFDNTQGVAAGPWRNPHHYGRTRVVGTQGAEYTVINQSRSWLPDPIGGICWWGPDCGDTSTFVPFYCGITELPEAYSTGNHWEFTRDSAWWAHNFVGNWATINWGGMYPYIVLLQDELESAEAAAIPVIDAEALDLYDKGNPGRVIKARRYLTDYCIANANTVTAAWWDLADFLIANFDDSSYPRYLPDGTRQYPSEEWMEACFP